MLNDGKWHALSEIQEKTKLDAVTIEQITGFLREYNLIIADETKNQIKIDAPFRKFLMRTSKS